MDSEKRHMLLDMAMRMARTDKEVNDGYVNAPYKVVYDGEMYIGRVRPVTNKDGEIVKHRLEVEKPVTHVGSEVL